MYVQEEALEYMVAHTAASRESLAHEITRCCALMFPGYYKLSVVCWGLPRGAPEPSDSFT